MVCKVANTQGEQGSATTVTIGGVSFPNPPARALFENPENSDNVSVDLCEWCATLARSFFSYYTEEVGISVGKENKQFEKFNEVRRTFARNVQLCLDKVLVQRQGYNLAEFLHVLCYL